jgi:transcriptional regulator with XRE-family HTH domain
VEAVAEPALSFAGLLRQFRTEARLTPEELAEAAGLSPRSVSDLERGVNRTAHKDTAVLLADALSLAGEVRVLFVAAARGRALAADVLTARRDGAAGGSAAAATRSLPRDIGSFTGREPELAQLLGMLAGLAVGQPISSRTAANAATAAWRSSPVCAADTCVLIRALPTGTTG